uniref:Integrase catalytic domain-containing protein n=1 Tax=Strongyloides venezuelensis TaxID=75913 RepID=A0A0K0FSP5_STRVS
MFCNFGFPRAIKSDNEPTFKLTKFVTFLSSFGIQHLTSSAHHHKGNSIAERFLRTLRERLRFYDVSNNTIYMCVFAHNNTKHTTTNMSPMSIILNTQPHPITGSPIHAKLNDMLDLFKTTTPQEQVTNSNLLHEGEKQKNTPQYEGPYIVVKHIYGDTYMIRKITGKGRMTGKELKINAEMLKKESISN